MGTLIGAVAATGLSGLAAAGATLPDSGPNHIFLMIGSRGKISFEGTGIEDAKLCEVIRHRRVYLRGDKDITYSGFSKAMDKIKHCGNPPVALIAEEARPGR